MRILFITDNFPPECNAPATRTYEHINLWQKENNVKITVITCFPNFPRGKLFKGYKNQLLKIEKINSIKIIRVWTYISKNEGTIKRIIDYVSFAVTSSVAGLFLKPDIIIGTSPQFFTIFAAYFLARIKNIPWIFELRDLWPESINTVKAIKNKSILSILEKIEIFFYKNCTKIIAVTQSFKKDLINRGINHSKIEVVENGVNLENFTIKNTFKKNLNLRNKFIIGYIGTIGMAHGIEFIVNSIPNIKIKNIHFLIIGDGSRVGKIKDIANKKSINNITIMKAVPRNEILGIYSQIDVALVNLNKSDSFKKVIPSKIFEAAACEKPILLGVEGESERIIKKFNAGICFKPENSTSFETAIKKIRDSKNYKKYQHGCKKLAAKYSREVLAKKMFSIIKDIKENS